MGFSVRGRGGAWQPASFIAHAWSILWRKDAGGVGLGSLRLLSPCMVDTMEKRRRQAVLRKTRAVCSSLGGLQGGDDEAAESGTEMVVRLGILGRRGMVAEMLAVVRITPFPLGTQGGVFQNDRRLSDRLAKTGACRSLFR